MNCVARLALVASLLSLPGCAGDPPPSKTAPATAPSRTAQECYDSAANFREAGNLESALTEVSEAIRIDPMMDRAYAFRAAVRRQQGDLAAAVTDSTLAVEINPSNVGAYVTRGAAQLRLGNLA